MRCYSISVDYAARNRRRKPDDLSFNRPEIRPTRGRHVTTGLFNPLTWLSTSGQPTHWHFPIAEKSLPPLP